MLILVKRTFIDGVMQTEILGYNEITLPLVKLCATFDSSLPIVIDDYESRYTKEILSGENPHFCVVSVRRLG